MNKYHFPEVSSPKQYRLLINALFSHSEAFSLIYFKHEERERDSRQVSHIKKKLSPYLLFSLHTNEMPSLITWDNRHVYELNVYRAGIDAFPAIDVLKKAASLWDWDYPKRPMDLCFFREGYAWFISSAHEKENSLYTDDPFTTRLFQDMGLAVESRGTVPDDSLYRLPQSS